MELRQLQHFVAVAEESHFTRAARRVNIVQSALSASIRSLEEELGAKLLLRSTRQVQMTAAGRVFLEKARRALELVREAREAVADLEGLRRGTLGIGTVQSLPAFLDLPSLLARFHAQHPAIEVRLCQGSTAHLLEKVHGGALDLAFVPLCEPPPGIVTTMIACEALVAVGAPGHWLAGQRELPLAALKGEPFVDFEPDWGTRRLIDRAFLAAGIERHIAFEVTDLGTLIELVGRGLGVALLPEAIAEERGRALAVARLAGSEVCWELAVAYVAGDDAQMPAGPAARALLALMNRAVHPAEAPA